MAKKKVVTLTEDPANVSQLVGTTGNVTLTLVKGSKAVKVHKINNTGVSRLFEGIARALVGTDSKNIQAYVPNYLGVAYKDPNQITIATNYNQTSLESNNMVIVPISRRDTREIETATRNAWVAIFEATIPASLLQSLKYRVNELGLFGLPEAASLLARIVTINDEGKAGFIEVEPGMTLIVQWEISIENKSKEI